MELLVKKNKVLRLTNVLLLTVDTNNEDAFENIDVLVEKAINYIKNKGTVQVGPLIQYNEYSFDEYKNGTLVVSLLLQCQNCIHNLDSPYRMESVMRIKDCYYCHYEGLESGLKYVYMKLQVEAFEDGVRLNGSNYTIFLDQNEEGTIVADVFMPKANED